MREIQGLCKLSMCSYERDKSHKRNGRKEWMNFCDSYELEQQRFFVCFIFRQFHRKKYEKRFEIILHVSWNWLLSLSLCVCMCVFSRAEFYSWVGNSKLFLNCHANWVERCLEYFYHFQPKHIRFLHFCRIAHLTCFPFD